MEKDPISPAALPKEEAPPAPTVDHNEGSGSELEAANWNANSKQLTKTIRKVDRIVLPVMTVLLAFAFIDRSNMGLAAVAGMTTDLGFKGFQYSVTLLVFFPGYALFVLPSNYLLQKTSVRYWLTILSVSFGIFTLAHGLVRNFAGIVAMRLFLGICEAG